MKKCPKCAEQIQDEAVFCKHCHSDLTPFENIKGEASKLLSSKSISENVDGAAAGKLSLESYSKPPAINKKSIWIFLTYFALFLFLFFFFDELVKHLNGDSEKRVGSQKGSASANETLEEKRMRQGLGRNIDLLWGGLLKPSLGPGKSKKLVVSNCDFIGMKGKERVEIGCTIQGDPSASGPLFYKAYDRAATLIDEGIVLGPAVPVSGLSEFRIIVSLQAEALTLYVN